MAINYEQIAQDTLSTIQNAGTPVVVTRVNEGAFDPSSGNTLPGSEVTATGQGVLTQYKTMDVDGTVIKRGDMKLLLAASGLALEPTTNDTVTIGSDVWTVLYVESVEPATVPVLYKVQIRR